MSSIIWLIGAVILGAFAQILFKLASVGSKDKTDLVSFYISLLFDYHLWLAVLCYGISFLIWLKLLTKLDITFARPFLGIGYVLTTILAIIILKEKVTIYRWIGIVLISSGLVFLIKSS